MNDISSKEERLVEILKGLDSCAIAFSGGLDSAFLSVMANKHVPGRVLCITLADPSTPKRDLETTIRMAKKHGLEHTIIHDTKLPASVEANPKNRCYHCKSCLFSRLWDIANQEGLGTVLDGENYSDRDDNRPGRRAALEKKVLSPLLEAGLDKKEIRVLASLQNLEVAQRPPSACLSSRVPTGTKIETMVLERVDHTEEKIRGIGMRLVRARQEGRGVRIELGGEETTVDNISKIMAIEGEIKAIGWDWVAVDLGGYMPAGKRGETRE